MRYLYLLFIIITLFASCGHQQERDPRLLTAGKLMKTNPDSARRLLLADSARMQQESKATRMSYEKLLTLADDKCYITHTSDTTMLDVAAYYESHGTPRQKFMSYYLLGRIYTDMNLTADAFEYYEKALAVDGVDSSFIYLSMANEHIGNIYIFQNMYEKALPYYEKARECAIAAKDTFLMIYTMRDIGRNYNMMGDKKKTLFFYGEVMEIMQKGGYDSIAQHIFPEIAIAYIDAKEYSKAKHCFRLSLAHLSEYESSTVYFVGGQVYRYSNDLDSAIHFYKRSVESSGANLYSKKNSAYLLYDIYRSRKQFDLASAYADSCSTYSDSARQVVLSQNENLIKSLKDKINIEKQNYELKNREYLLMSLLFVAIIIVACISYMLHRIVKAKNERYRKVKEALALFEQSSRERVSERIKMLDAEIARNNDDPDMQKKLSIDKRRETLRLEEINIKKEKQRFAIGQFLGSDQCRLLREKADAPQENSNITSENWKVIYTFMNEDCDMFVDKLNSLFHGISEKEIQICCLIKLELTNIQISNILNQTASATSVSRRRLYEKMFHKKESAEMLNQFILSFPDNP